MANEFGKAIDKTFLSIDQAETRGFLHRDLRENTFWRKFNGDTDEI